MTTFTSFGFTRLKALKIQGGNNKAIYVTVPAGKLIQIYKTFFGKEGIETNEGELFVAIRKENPSFLTDNFLNLLNDVFSLKQEFLAKLTVFNENKGINEITPKAITEKLDFSRNQNLALITVKIKSQIYFGELLFIKIEKTNHQGFFCKRERILYSLLLLGR